MTKTVPVEILASAAAAAVNLERRRAANPAKAPSNSYFVGEFMAEETILALLFQAPWSHSLTVPAFPGDKLQMTFRRSAADGRKLCVTADGAPFLWWIEQGNETLCDGQADSLVEAVQQAETAAEDLAAKSINAA